MDVYELVYETSRAVGSPLEAQEDALTMPKTESPATTLGIKEEFYDNPDILSSTMDLGETADIRIEDEIHLVKM